MKKPKSRYAEYAPLRAVCENFSDRLALGQTIRNGWTASTLSALGQDFFDGGRGFSPKDYAYQQAILMAATKRYVEGLSVHAMPLTDEEQAKADQRWEEKQAQLRAQFPAPPPVIPSHAERIRFNRLLQPSPEDRTALDSAFRAGWSPKALDHLAHHIALFRYRCGKRAAMREAIAIAGAEGNTDHLKIRAAHRFRPDIDTQKEEHS